MEFLFWLISIISILCLLYYCLIIAYSGFGTTFSQVWLIAGFIGIFVGMIIRSMLNHKIEISRRLSFLFIFILIIGLLLFGIVEGTLIYNSGKRDIRKVDYIIILGAQVRGTTISKTLLRRLDTAAAYLKKNPKTIAIVSGGKGDDAALSEAEAMERYLEASKIPAYRIVKEDKSRNTFENFLYSKALITEKSSVALVTNGFHVFRSLRIARKQGLTDIQVLSAPTDRILAVNYYVREAVGVIKEIILGNF